LANTEITYLKKKIAQLETDFASFASLLIQAGIVEVVEEDGQRIFKVNKVKLDA
jgi:predicted transcriptional regulator with HTH domain